MVLQMLNESKTIKNKKRVLNDKILSLLILTSRQKQLDHATDEIKEKKDILNSKLELQLDVIDKQKHKVFSNNILNIFPSIYMRNRYLQEEKKTLVVEVSKVDSKFANLSKQIEADSREVKLLSSKKEALVKKNKELQEMLAKMNIEKIFHSQKMETNNIIFKKYQLLYFKKSNEKLKYEKIPALTKKITGVNSLVVKYMEEIAIVTQQIEAEN